MTKNDSVQNEQFGKSEDKMTPDSSEADNQNDQHSQNENSTEAKEPKGASNTNAPDESEAVTSEVKDTEETVEATSDVSDEPDDITASSENSSQEIVSEVETEKPDPKDSASPIEEETTDDDKKVLELQVEDISSKDEIKAEPATEPEVEEKQDKEVSPEPKEKTSETTSTASSDAEVPENPKTEIKKEASASPAKYQAEKIDYAKLSKEDLVKVLKDLIDGGHIGEIRKEVEAIKTNFYKKHLAEVEAIKSNFLEEGGLIQDFKLEDSPVEINLKELLNKYRELRHDMSKKLEDEKDSNLKRKYEIIEHIKDLVNSQESLNKTFHDFREFQNEWREVGPVPQQYLKDLWESYHYHVEAFYDYIKINKELRDLDFKKNFESKIKLCEAAEELLLEPSVVEAFRQLQKLHDQWREIGPTSLHSF